MRRIIYLFLVLPVFSGCSEEWLEIEQQNEHTSPAFCRNEADALATITSAYDPTHSLGLHALQAQFLSYSHDNRVLIEFPYWNDLQLTSNEYKIESTYMYLFKRV